MFTIQYQALEFMNSLGILIPIVAILLPAFIVLIVFVYESKISGEAISRFNYYQRK